MPDDKLLRIDGGIDRRKTPRTDKLRNKLLKLAAEGKTDKELAKAAGMHPATLYSWYGDEEVFHSAVKRAKAAAMSAEAEGYYIKMARGFYYTETKIETFPDGAQKTTKQQRYQPPNPQVARTLLARLDPSFRETHEVRGKVDHEHHHGLDPALQEMVQALTEGDTIDQGSN